MNADGATEDRQSFGGEGHRLREGEGRRRRPGEAGSAGIGAGDVGVAAGVEEVNPDVAVQGIGHGQAFGEGFRRDQKGVTGFFRTAAPVTIAASSAALREARIASTSGGKA